MVGPDLLTNAVSLNSTIFNGARLVGPSVAGLLIGAASGNTAPAFFVNAASFGFTIVALASMPTDELRPSAPVARGKGQLRAGRLSWKAGWRRSWRGWDARRSGAGRPSTSGA